MALVWWNETGIVGAVQFEYDTSDFVRGWSADWWPFTAVQKPDGAQ